ncbi:MAG: aminotransferase class V-fold PLP-dependent enzyme, partial [Bacillota bacterium]
GAQAAGAIRVDVNDIGCDFYALPGQKWLLGPEGTGAFYCRLGRLEELALRGVAWASTESRGIWEDYRLKPDAARFELASINASTFVALGEAVDFIASIGMREIEARIASLCGYLKGELSRIPGVLLFTPVQPEKSAGLVAFAIARLEPENAVEMLFERWKIVSRSIPWPRAIRVSIHFFNTEEEVETLVRAVRTLTDEA